MQDPRYALQVPGYWVLDQGSFTLEVGLDTSYEDGSDLVRSLFAVGTKLV